MKFWIPKHLIKKWITIAGRKIPIVNRLLARRHAERVFRALGVRTGPATEQSLRYCDKILDYIPFARTFYSPKLRSVKRVSALKLLQVSRALERCEQLFPGVARGLKLQFFSLPMDVGGFTVVSRRLSARVVLDAVDAVRVAQGPGAARIARGQVLRMHRVMRSMAKHVDEGTILLNTSNAPLYLSLIHI